MARVLMVHFSPYPVDVRIRREAETLVESGMSVDTISIGSKNQKTKEIHHGVTTYRVNLSKKRSSKLRYIWEYLLFTLIAFIRVALLYRKNKYDLIHIHNMPDFLVFCALIPKMAGAKIILDLHDPVPEIYMTKYDLSENHPIIRILILIEQICIKFADHIITPNEAFRDLFIRRGCTPKKINVVMNTPMERIFLNNLTAPKEILKRHSHEFVLMYHGTVALRNGCLDILDAINEIKNEIPEIRYHVFGNGDSVEMLENRILELGLSKLIKYYGLVPNETISDAIKNIDVGIIPNQMNPFTNHNFPVRIFEYLALRKPVIVPKTKGILDYFDQDSIIYFEPGNVSNLAEVILNCYKFPDQVRDKMEKGFCVYQKYTWQKQRKTLEEIALNLIKNSRNR